MKKYMTLKKAIKIVGVGGHVECVDEQSKITLIRKVIGVGIDNAFLITVGFGTERLYSLEQPGYKPCEDFK